MRRPSTYRLSVNQKGGESPREQGNPRGLEEIWREEAPQGQPGRVRGLQGLYGALLGIVWGLLLLALRA